MGQNVAYKHTIHHIFFLQSVIKHVDQLKDNFDGGATWTFEVGSQSMGSPIIVKDLNLPRHMLVEILFKKEYFFSK